MSTIFTHLLLYVWVFTQGFFYFFIYFLLVWLAPHVALTFSEACLLCFSLTPHPGCHLELSLCQPQKNGSVNRLRRPRNQRGKAFLPMCGLCMHLSKDTWLCQLTVRVSPLFHCVDSTKMQICWGRLPRQFCTTWAVLLSTVCVCKWVYGLSVLKAGMHHWILKTHPQLWLITAVNACG